jgi:hypothetical protein
MRTRLSALVATLVSTSYLWACSSHDSGGPPATDGGEGADANDAALGDAASGDAASGQDGGSFGDAASSDTGSGDTGSGDTGSGDTGSSDASSSDAGSSDAGVSDAATASDGGYSWKNVVIGGGGWITGLVRDAKSGDLFARADVGGLYRWDTDHWTPLLEKFSFADANEYGVQSVALSPNYATDHTVYFAAGKYGYAAHDLFKSTDRGNTWTASDFPVPMAANLDDRWCGERLAIDPNNAEVGYFGSPYENDASATAGLWASTSGSSPGSWANVSSFKVTGEKGEGLSFVAFDPGETTTLDGGSVRSSTIYVGVVDTSDTASGVYRSTNAGSSWERLPGSSQHSPCRGVVASDGTLYVSFRANTNGTAGGVARIARGGTSLTEVDLAGAPSDAGYYAIAVDPSDPDTVYTTQSEGPVSRPDVMHVTHDAGSAWSDLPYATPSTMAITQNKYTWFSGPAAMVINPSNVNEAWLTDGFGIMHTSNLTTSTTPTWNSQVTGIEEIVPDAMLSLPTGSIPLLSGASDVGGFIHTSLTSPPTSRLPDDSEAISYDFCRSNPSIVVYTGHYYYSSTDPFHPYLAKSTDGGQSFKQVTAPTGGNGGGRIAIAPKDCNRWVLQTFDGSLFVTTDSGSDWTQVSGGPSVSTLSGANIHNDTVYQQQLATDDVSGDFYIATVTPPTVSPLSGGSASVYRSTDGVTWTKAGTITFPSVSSTEAQDLIYDEINWHYNLRTTPGKQGNVWLAVRNIGVYHSTDGAATFAQLSSVTTSGLLALGVPPTGSTTPTVFVHTAEGHFLRSDDLGGSFVSIDDPTNAVGDDPAIIEGDRQVWGRVFVGTNGRGIYVGAVN